MSRPKFIGVEEPDFAPAGNDLAELIKDRIRAAPGDRWNKTGRLLNSITFVDNGDRISVVTGADRLQSDTVAHKFADEILPEELDSDTRAAIATAIFESFKVDT